MAVSLVLFAVYVVTAQVGFYFAFVAEQVTMVWAPTGIAVSALLLFGAALWPAVWLGAFVANVGADVPLWVAAVIASGNALEAWVAVRLLRRVPDFTEGLDTVRSVVAFLGFGVLLATTISPTIGVLALLSSEAQPWSRFSELWWDWWLGDALGALVVAPVILAFATKGTAWARQEIAETAAVLSGALVATQLVFGRFVGLPISRHPLEFIIFPFVIAAAVRLRPAATALVTLGTSSIAVWNTARGAGPFADPDVHQSLMLLQAFTGVLAGTGMVLAAAIAERRLGDRRRSTAYSVGEILGKSSSLAEAAPLLLESISARLDWQLAALWEVDQSSGCLRCTEVWHEPSLRADSFIATSRQTAFVKGRGLPGRVWSTGRAAWIEDVVLDANFPRARVATDAGLHGAFAFPVVLGDEVLGVVECFNKAALKPDADLLVTMSTVGSQIGQFMRRRSVEANMGMAQGRSRAILDTALDAIIGMNHEGRITEFNPAAERMFGYSADQAINQELAALLIPASLSDAHREGVARYLAEGHGPFIDRRVETTARRADGGEFPVEVAITRVPGEEPPRFAGFVRDLSARVQADREREDLLGRELRARHQAEAANSAKDDFLATLSHELRTPLNAIAGWTRMLLEGTMDKSATLKALTVIDRNAQLQTQLIADLLDVSRIISGGMRLNSQPVDLVAIVSAAIDAVRPAAEAKGVALRGRLDETVPVGRGDPARLQQVVWNLLANAVKFTPSEGTIEVVLSPAANGGAELLVRDSGCGIDPDFLPHVFERFRQADATWNRSYGGLGLGLAIVRHLVELHGGTVRAASDGLGKGATFTVYLPAGERLNPEGSADSLG